MDKDNNIIVPMIKYESLFNYLSTRKLKIESIQKIIMIKIIFKNTNTKDLFSICPSAEYYCNHYALNIELNKLKDDYIIISEGWATAMACFTMTGIISLAALSASNLPNIINIIRKIILLYQ